MNKELFELLEENGFKQYESTKGSSALFQKRIDGEYHLPTLCSTNDKLFVDVNYYSFSMPDRPLHEGVEISIRHGAKDDKWFDLKMYSITPDEITTEFLKQTIDRLMAAWEAVNA